MNLHLTDLRLTVTDPDCQRTGLLGWISMTVGGALLLDGVALRRTAAGRLTLSFPERTDQAGRRHPYVRPVDDDARREIEVQVFAALGLEDAEARR